jgi:DNA-binding transcriptional MerR regulator
MEEMSIGEFARRSRLSPKALRLYDDLGLLPPARVDTITGYRYYRTDQLDPARLVASLRQLGLALTEIKAILDLEPEAAADRVAGYWSAVETDHTARRELAGVVVNRLLGKRPDMYEVETREIPSRSVLCLKRSVEGVDGAWALGKEFVALFKERSAPRLDGRAGAAFCIYWGEVTDDSDGPLEWCRPVPGEEAETLASQFPELYLRVEPAHGEAFVDIGTGGRTSGVEWQLVSESLRAWADERGVEPVDLGVRITYLASPPRAGGTGPDCDFAVPFASRTA